MDGKRGVAMDGKIEKEMVEFGKTREAVRDEGEGDGMLVRRERGVVRDHRGMG